MSSVLCALPLVAALLPQCSPPDPFATGYVEGDYVLVAPTSGAEIANLAVARGDRVASGDVLARMEKRDAEIALAEAEAELARARAELANLKQGRREAEIRAIEARLASARAQAEEARREADRLRSLFARDVTSQAQLDRAVTAADVAEAEVRAIEAELEVARLPARPHEIDAAQAAVARGAAVRDRAQWALEERVITAPAAGRIDDVIRTPGEIAGPSAPILSLLPDGAVKLRLYVPETAISRIAVGDALSVGCDGCPDGLTAQVVYVANSPEFTPPVIYSLENRQKLVYLIEARPGPEAGMLKPGQIVDVRLPADTGGAR